MVFEQKVLKFIKQTYLYINFFWLKDLVKNIDKKCLQNSICEQNCKGIIN